MTRPLALDGAGLAATLEQCGMTSAWAEGVAARAPFATHADLLAASEQVLARLDDASIRAALERVGHEVPDTGDAGVIEAARLAASLYADRFGYAFVSGIDTPTAEALLMRIRIRLGNDPQPEWRAAREHLRRRMRARLQVVLSQDEA